MSGPGDPSRLNTDQIKQQERVFAKDILFSDGVPLYADETVEDLQRSGFRLLQKKNRFRFGTDSVLLAAYVAAHEEKTPRRRLLAADLGAGCGAVSILLAARLPGVRIVGFEVDPVCHDVLVRNICLNSLQDRVWAERLDIRLLAGQRWPLSGQTRHSFDLVVGNPPYLKPEQTLQAGCSRLLPKPSLAAGQADSGNGPGPDTAVWPDPARDESALSLNDFLAAAASLLKPRGRLVIVHRAHRLPDVLASLRPHGLEARTLRLVLPLPDRPPSVFLLSATRLGKPGGFRLEAPLLVADEPGRISTETDRWYGRERPLSDEERFHGLVRRQERR